MLVNRPETLKIFTSIEQRHLPYHSLARSTCTFKSHLFCTRYHSRTMNITLFTAMTMYVPFRAQIVRVVSRWSRLTGWPQKCAAAQAPSHPPAQRIMDHTPPSFSRFSPFSGSAVRGYAQCRYSSAVLTSALTSFIQRPIVITSAIVSL